MYKMLILRQQKNAVRLDTLTKMCQLLTNSLGESTHLVGPVRSD